MNLKRAIAMIPFVLAGTVSFAQSNVITQWNFNSNPPDNNTSTGSNVPSVGVGTISTQGGTASSFASGSAGNGSTDPATTDNSGYGLTTFPAQGLLNKTAGFLFTSATTGFQNIEVSFDLRHSGTASAIAQLQYTLDATATNPIWVDFDTVMAVAHDTWFSRSFNLSSITGLNNNANAGFRIVSGQNASNVYVPANSAGNYAAGGTWRVDMLTIKGTPVSTSTLPNLVITEIAHSPNTIEFIEVYNAGTTPIDLTGLYFAEGTSGNFPSQILAAGATILFSTAPTTASSLMGGTYHLLGAGLGSSSDILVIRNASGQTIDSVAYFVGTNGWAAAPTPTSAYYGYSFELNSATLDNNVGSNWTNTTQNIISSVNGPIWATPGVYPPPAPNPAPIVTSYTQNSATTTTVVFNQNVTTATAQALANYVFIPALTLTNAVLSGNNTVTLTHAAMTDGLPYKLAVNGVMNSSALANVADTANLIWNNLMPNLVITEIIHSPNDIEMIEVYNAGTTAIPLGGLKWTDGTTGNFPVITLAAGANVVFATSPTTTSSILNVPTVYTINNGLGSSSDDIVIRNSANQIVDSVNYFVGTNGWPTAPTGVHAYSFELIAANLDNNVGSNWIVPFNQVTPQPTPGIVRATPGVYPAPPVTGLNPTISFVGTNVSVDENTATVQVIAKINNGNATASAASLVLQNFGTATAGTDFVLPSNLVFNFPANSNNVNDTITIQITDDNIAENAEYFIFSLDTAVNASLPVAASNYFTVFIKDNDKVAPVAAKSDFLTHISSFNNGNPSNNSLEIVAHDKLSQRIFVANSIGAKIDILDFSNPANITLIRSIDISPYGNINSIAAYNGKIVASIENTIPEEPGKAVFFDTAGNFITAVNVGAMPDMITFTHDGQKVLTANEGQPKSDYTVDPEGSVSIIDISGGLATLSNANVATADFQAFNSQAASLKAAGVRIFGPNASVAQDMEPEYITVAADNSKAWVTCQENNAIAVVDLTSNTITDILPLGFKDHSVAANALDGSDQGSDILIANYPIKGVYMPDAISSYTVGGTTYLVTANEGDAREYSAYEEAVRLGSSSYKLDTVAFPNHRWIKNQLGRLNVTLASGDANGDGFYEEIHAFGGRSFTIWNATTGALVYDNGQDFELITAQHPELKSIFNASNSNNTFKNRSDDKGPEPEGVTVATIGSKIYAFIALERIGGVMVYDVTNPTAPIFVDYKNSRTITSYGGDNGAEGIIYIDSASSPNNKPYVVVANEVSSTMSVFEVKAPIELNIIDKANQNFCHVYPNPTQASVSVVIEGDIKNGKLTVVDLSGKIIETIVIKNNATQIDMKHYATGNYIIHFSDDNRSGAVKVQKL